MKKVLFLSVAILFIAFSSIAQSNVQLNIHHKLGDISFQSSTASLNNIDNDVKFRRIEYYISEISLIHDGGTETLIEDLYLLINPNLATEVNLGDYPITQIEKLKFHIGVDPEHNYLDPASYDADHPLAPKSPSMHWGWAAGYRFIVVEGNGGANYDQAFELHGLGSENYFTTEIDLDITVVNNQISINIDADYTRTLENIDVSAGLIVHDDDNEAKQSIENFRDYVFSASSIVNSVVDFSEVSNFNISPNFVINGQASIEFETANNKNNYDLKITSIDGQQMQYIESIENGNQVNLNNYSSGIYLFNLVKEGQVVITNKVIVK